MNSGERKKYLAEIGDKAEKFIQDKYPDGNYPWIKGTHKMSGTRTYVIWASMKSRCLNKNTGNYKYYGGRGIIVCERWMKFEDFYKDMGSAPERLTLDRIKNSGDYELPNCKWATRKEQQNNTRKNRWIEFNGERKTLTQWSKNTGISAPCIAARIKRGLNLVEVFAPIKQRQV